ncbi:RNA-binding protein 25 [Biomphalaria pfeifferi]|uniref:RNA-binding protein 25 n=1 Tax=Biomphalaria pfeifferi TaxID=112525 RepID=A0AAD8BF33_BIOPF|nr:RNA-binding protein 25 [Biomphalaria pfeifferi]
MLFTNMASQRTTSSLRGRPQDCPHARDETPELTVLQVENRIDRDANPMRDSDNFGWNQQESNDEEEAEYDGDVSEEDIYLPEDTYYPEDIYLPEREFERAQQDRDRYLRYKERLRQSLESAWERTREWSDSDNETSERLIDQYEHNRESSRKRSRERSARYRNRLRQDRVDPGIIREPAERIYDVIESSSDIAEQALGRSLHRISRALRQSLDGMDRTLGRSFIRIGQSRWMIGEDIQRVRERPQSDRYQAEIARARAESGRARAESGRARAENGRAERKRERAELGRERAQRLQTMAALDPYIEEAVLIIRDDVGSSTQIDNSRPTMPEPPGLTWSELDVLPTAVHYRDMIPDGEAASSDVRCSICLKDFESGDQKLILPCVHNFHIECGDKWLRRNATCPVCRHLIK